MCPSCKTPLVARHGHKIAWHFAHITRSTESKTESECQYSFFVSVRLMARQIVGDNLKIKLPAYNDQITSSNINIQRFVSESFTITEAQEITLKNIEVEKTVQGKPVDIYGHIGEFSFILYFIHPNREIPVELIHPNDKRCGVITISLTELMSSFLGAKKAGNSYQSILNNFLVNNLTSKKWIFHPRYSACLKEAEKKLSEKENKLLSFNAVRNTYKRRSSINRTNKIAKNVIDKEQKVKRLANFTCVMCHTKWQDFESNNSTCPSCKKHIFRKFLGFVEEL